MKKRLPLRIQQHRQVNEVLVVVDPPQGVAVMQHVWISLELKVVLCELKAPKAEHHALHGSVCSRCHQHFAASFLQGQSPQRDQLQDLSATAHPFGPQVLCVHGGVAAEAVVGVVQTGLETSSLIAAEPSVQQGSRGGGEDVIEGGVDCAARWCVGVCDLPHFNT